MEIIALSGYARSGKDAASQVLVNEFGFTRVAFADKLRDMLYALNPIVDKSPWDRMDVDFILDLPTDSPVKVQNVIDYYGWNGWKETVFATEIRRLLQRLGTEAGRQTLWDSIWVDAAFANLDDDAKVVITDARFVNEAMAVKSRGGKVWRIERLNVGPANDHPSETSLDNWNFDDRIYNAGNLEELHEQVRLTYLGEG